MAYAELRPTAVTFGSLMRLWLKGLWGLGFRDFWGVLGSGIKGFRVGVLGPFGGRV